MNLSYYSYFTNVAVEKNATNDLINKIWFCRNHKMPLVGTSLLSVASIFVILNRACLSCLREFTFAWIIDMPRPHLHCKFRDELIQ